MDPPMPMDENTLHGCAASYNLSEIWQFPVNDCGESSGSGLELRMTPFGLYFGQFGENREVCGNDSIGGELRRGGRGGRKRREAAGSEDESAMCVSPSSSNDMNDSDGKRLNKSRSRNDNHNYKADGKGNSLKEAEQNSEVPPELPKDYIHVRARRGQATDSHSLAERARREKISERMRILQDLVPGCNKVIGKALVLDEIINYIQSLQRQVEVLSMKLEAVNSRMTIDTEGYPSKDLCQQAFHSSGAAYDSQASREYAWGSSPEWLHMQIRGGFERQT
ncbi:hypothetical protein Nepgr_003507 [Nepenthes gracilis]|uniref:BHLH domain-containing protein n=1 Tax=Nepenthes gracilis TaxID=150966 RepID=A0AAD3RZR7_NEPGR|nr:hypothetical protein Nepgr_003507 [Nepenthes gracilis]